MRNSAVSAEGVDAGGWEDWMEAGAEDHMQVDTDRDMKALLRLFYGCIKAVLRMEGGAEPEDQMQVDTAKKMKRGNQEVHTASLRACASYVLK